jgi:hypothetical protein
MEATAVKKSRKKEETTSESVEENKEGKTEE